MHQKKIERQALMVGIVVNIVMAIAGYVVFFMTGLNAMFLDATFTLISVVSGGVAAFLSKRTVRTSERYPNGMFALEPIYAICKAVFTIGLLLFSFLDVVQVAIDYFVFGIGEPMSFGPVVYYQIAAVIVCLVLVGYYRSRNKSIGNASTMLRAEANGTWIDGMISLGIGIVAVLLVFLPMGTPLDFLHYTGDFFITTAIVILTIKEPFEVLRDAFVELVGGVHDDKEIDDFVEGHVKELVPSSVEVQQIHIFKTGMNFDVDIIVNGTGESVRVEDLVEARNQIEKALEPKLHIVNVDFVFE
ncbi:MAG: cation transporter [Bifidobacterium sp.]|nr:cation transporter [Bifidobacterium sp.]